MWFPMVTLNDLERRNGRYFALLRGIRPCRAPTSENPSDAHAYHAATFFAGGGYPPKDILTA